MKYIRTESDVFRVIKGDDEQHVTYDDGEMVGVVPKEWVIKQSDSIEELCDEFVCMEDHSLLRPVFRKRNDDGYPTETYSEGIRNALRLGVNFVDYTWLGAIWAEKGLIYVAKLNKKGEWELL